MRGLPVHLNGAPVRSCVTPISAAVGQKITTIEAIAADDKVGKAARRLGQARRGPVRLLPKRPDHERHRAAQGKKKPTDADIDAAMAGNVPLRHLRAHPRRHPRRRQVFGLIGSKLFWRRCCVLSYW